MNRHDESLAMYTMGVPLETIRKARLQTEDREYRDLAHHLGLSYNGEPPPRGRIVEKPAPMRPAASQPKRVAAAPPTPRPAQVTSSARPPARQTTAPPRSVPFPVPPHLSIFRGTSWGACVHEAGHAAVGTVLGLGVRKATTRVGTVGRSRVWRTGRGTPDAEAAFLLAGAAAEWHFTDRDPREISADAAIDLAMLDALDLDWSAMQQARDRAEQLVVRHRVGIHRVALALAERGELDGADVRAVLGW